MQVNYIANPTAVEFHASEKVCRGFKGPVGNGKSVTCITEAFRISSEQWPNAAGIRKSRGVIVRNTNPELRTTTLNTWKQWVPEQICPITMHPIIMGKIEQPLKDGTRIECEVYFLALDREEDVKKLLSLECTWVFLNEARELPFAVVKAARERIGRYPAEVDGYKDVWEGDQLIYDAPKERNPDGSPKLDEDGEIQYLPCRRKALLMDTNPPAEDHWWYHLAVIGHLPKAKNKALARAETERVFDFFDGPSPLIQMADGSYVPNPDAENIKHLPGGYQYYLDMIAGNTEDHINVMVLGNYGTIVEGRPVYTAYNDNIHCPQGPFAVSKELEICLGWDFGLTPAVVLGQQTPEGQCRTFAELCAEDMDVKSFARDVVKPFLQRHFKGFSFGFSLGDPSGNNRGEGEGKSAIGILNDEYLMEDEEPLDMGFTTEPAPTNDITLRVAAVQNPMLRLLANGQPAYVLNPSCKMLRQGKRGGYHYKRVQVAGDERYQDKPNKNRYSHPADAEQYLYLGFQQGLVVDVEEDDYDEYENELNISSGGY